MKSTQDLDTARDVARDEGDEGDSARGAALDVALDIALDIVLVTALYPPEFAGGVECVVRAQARELVRAGHRVRIVCGTQTPFALESVVRDEVDGIAVARVPRFVHERYDLVFERTRVAELVARECSGADLVHVHHTWTLSTDLVRSLARAAPVAWTLHDHFASCPRFFRSSPIAGHACPSTVELAAHAAGEVDAHACVRCVARDAPGRSDEALADALRARRSALRAELESASLLIAPSASHRRALATSLALDAERVHVVRHGLCHELLDGTSATHAQPQFPWDGRRALRVVFLGNRCEAKGALDLVHALAAQAAGSCELWFLGREVEPGFDARLRHAAGALPVRFLGAYEGRDLARLARGADVCAQPSRVEESYALVVEEALALGLPTWVGARGAAHELLTAGLASSDPLLGDVVAPGRVLPSGDVEAWTKAFRELIADPIMLVRQRAALPTTPRRARDAVRELLVHYQRLAAPTIRT